MRLRAAVLLCCLLLMLTASDAGKCRKRKGGKKCDRNRSTSVGPPRWRRRSPKDSLMILREHSNAVLKCQVLAKPRPKYKWLKDGKILAVKKSKKYRRRRHRLMVNDLTMSDSGNYTCEVSNIHGSLNWTFSIKVLGDKPVMTEINIVERPKNQTSHIGDTVVFMCRTDTWPRPQIQWSRILNGKPEVQILQKSSNSTKAEVLVLHNVTKMDAGVYTCNVHNKMSNKQSKAFLTVIAQGEELPFEPKCDLHVRKEILLDSVFGCQTVEPVEITYCMGSCGRSYFVPTVVTTDKVSVEANHINQTCQCCVGLVQGIRIVQLDCPSGGQKRGFYTMLRGCACRSCNVEGEIKKTNGGQPSKPP